MVSKLLKKTSPTLIPERLELIELNEGTLLKATINTNIILFSNSTGSEVLMLKKITIKTIAVIATISNTGFDKEAINTL